jgi:hypothetical protein
MQEGAQQTELVLSLSLYLPCFSMKKGGAAAPVLCTLLEPSLLFEAVTPLRALSMRIS